MWMLLTSLAFAADPPVPVPAEIVPLSEGAVVTPPGAAKFTTRGLTFLLPEKHYNNALVKARMADTLQVSLTESMALTTQCVAESRETLRLLDQAAARVDTAEQRRLVSEAKLTQVRSQRNLAWGIAGGLILGAVAVTAVVIGG